MAFIGVRGLAVPRLTRAGSRGRVELDRDRFTCGPNSFGNGPRAEPGLAKQVQLVLVWNTKLGRGKKKRQGGGTGPAQTDELVERGSTADRMRQRDRDRERLSGLHKSFHRAWIARLV
jgi:hypothetical protein